MNLKMGAHTREELSKEDLAEVYDRFPILKERLDQVAGELVDRLIVLNEGEVLIDDDAETVVNDERVVNVYTGKPLDAE